MTNGRVSLVTGPTVEPVTLNEALNQCHCDAGIEDAWFTARIKSGRILAQNYQRQSYITQTWKCTFDRIPTGQILLPMGPVIALSSIIVYDENNAATSMTLSDFHIDTASLPARLIINDNADWPVVTLRDVAALVITYTAGYGATSATVPDHVKDAILLYVAYSYNNRAGEDKIPDAFYSLLKPGRVY
jgi:uncharacterized phiE125 gp8 family phage protein